MPPNSGVSKSGFDPRTEERILRFESAWRTNQPPRLSDFLPADTVSGDTGRLKLLKELIKIDLEFRARLSKEDGTASTPFVLLENYVSSFSELRQAGKVPLDLITEEYRVRRRWHETLDPGEYVRRFPEHAGYLRKALDVVEQDMLAEFASIRARLSSPNAVTIQAQQDTLPPNKPSPNRSAIHNLPTVAPTPASASSSRLGSATHFPQVPGYEVIGLLGRGGMGIVYKARHLALKRLVALKMIVAGELAGPEQLARFRGESQAAARLSHPNIVQIYEVGEHNQLPYFALEYVDGGSLDRLIHGAPQNPRFSAQLVMVLAEAMHEAHQHGIVHRDLKPANILLASVSTSSGVLQGKNTDSSSVAFSTEHGFPKITDFGLAKQLDSSVGQTQSGAIMGTPSYMAPEQAAGRVKSIGPGTDVYSLGAILYECLTGRPPFKADTPMEIVMQVIAEEPVSPRRYQPKVPLDLETVCLRCLEKEPAARYPDARTLADDLGRFLRGEPIKARPISVAGRLLKWTRRRPAVATSLGSTALLIVVFLLFLLNQRLPIVVPTDPSDPKLVKVSKVLSGHKDWVMGVTFIPNGKVLSCSGSPEPESSDNTVRLWDVETQKEITSFTGHGDDINSVAVSSDGRKAISASWDTSIRVWAIEERKQIAMLRGHKSSVRAAVFSTDGSRAISGGDDHLVVVWSLQTGKPIRTLRGHTRVVRSVALSPDERFVASAGDDQTVRLWDVETGEEIRCLRGHSAAVNSIAFSPEGDTLISGANAPDKSLVLWDLKKGEEIRRFEGHENHVTSVAFSPLGTTVLSGSLDRTVRLWNIDTGEESHRFEGHNDHVLAVAYSPDSPRIVSGSKDTTVRVWQLPGIGSETYQKLLGRLRKKDAAPQPLHLLATLKGHTATVPWVAFSPDGNRALSGSDNDDRTVRLWDLRSNAPIKVFRGHTDWTPCVAFSADGKFGFSGSGWNEGQIRVWNLESGETVQKLKYERCGLWQLVVSKDGKRILSAHTDGTIRMWDWQTATELKRIQAHKADAMAVAWATDETWAVSAGRDQTLKIWSLSTGGLKKGLIGLRGHARVMSISPCARWIAAGGMDDATIHLWDVRTGDELKRFSGHTGPVHGLTFSPNSRRLLSSSWDRTVRLWEVETAAEIGRAELPAQAEGAAISPDGRQALTGGKDNVVRLWQLPWQEPEFPIGTWVDVLGTVELDKHAISGRWEQVGREFHIKDKKEFSKLAIPVTPTGNYELEATLTRDYGNGEINLIIPVGSASCMFSIIHRDGWRGLQSVNGRPYRKTAVPDDFRNGVQHKVELKVEVGAPGTQSRIIAALDGKPVYEWKGKPSMLSSRADWQLHPSTLGLGVHQDVVRFHGVKMRVLTDRASYVPIMARSGKNSTAPAPQTWPEDPASRYRAILDAARQTAKSNPKDAVALYHQAIDAFAKTPNTADPEEHLEHAWVRNALGLLLKGLGESADAEKEYRAALKLLEPHAAALSDNPRFRSGMGAFLNNLAIVLRDDGRTDEARALVTQAVGHQLAARSMDPGKTQYRQFLRNHYVVLADTCHKQGDHHAAFKAAAELPQLNPNSPQECLDAAKLIAGSMVLAKDDNKLTTDEKKELTKRYAQEAERILRIAKDRGFEDFTVLEKDSRFEILRDRSGVRELILGSPARAKSSKGKT